MSIATDLLRAHRVGIRDLKEHLTTKLLHEPLIITDRGTPVSVNVPYLEMMEFLDILDEIEDIETVMTIQEGRKTIKAGAKGIPVSRLFKKIRARRNR
ncbi:MAG: hypothetical protein KKH11_00945 [Candidatus Omnitrophica bacterium]|nr:hypothetical protein [Candidatus Omnitrophota bacterium]